MAFKPTSGRLNFFFGKNTWLLLRLAEPEPAPGSQTALSNACRHWGSKLAFPPNIEASNFEESQDAREYWTRQFPGLALLHYRKQHILIQDLAASYQPVRAATLLCRKLKLPIEGWGYLVWIGPQNQCHAMPLANAPEGRSWHQWIAEFYQSGVWVPHASEADASDDAFLTGLFRQYEHGNGIPEAFAGVLRFLVANDRQSDVFSSLREAEAQPAELRLNFHRCSLEFPALEKEVRMQPLVFAIYNLYLQNENGFRNKERFGLIPQAMALYRRVRSTETEQGLEAAVATCFDVRDDAPFRDAVYKANRAIEQALGKNPFSSFYTIRGPRGGKRHIILPRELVISD
jgi:hypothetical protein